MTDNVLNIVDNRNTIMRKGYDVIVVGGGIAGIAAAVSSAREGASTLLIEKQINLGGLATTGLINWYEPLCDGEGNKIIGGVAEEMIKLSIKYSFENLPAKWGGEGKNSIHYDRYATRFSPTVFSLALDEYVIDSGAEIKFDTLATCPVKSGDTIIGVLTETVEGKEFYPCKILIDTTGDASVSMRAGIPTELGDNWLVYVCHTLEDKAIEAYTENRDMPALRKWMSCGGDMNGNGNIEGVPKQVMTDSISENNFILTSKKHIFERYKNKYKNKNGNDIMTLPTMPQYRKIRRIIGEYTFTGSQEERFSDSIGFVGDFRASGKRYQLPFSALYNKSVPNLLTAGRIISAAGDGWEIVRVIPVCALTGQAAGTAASLLLANDMNYDSIIAKLQKKLIKTGILIDN